MSYYHDDQNKVRGHWGIAANIPPEASAIQATPTSFVSVSKWTRTHTNSAAVRRRLRRSTTRSIRRTTSLTCSRRAPAAGDARRPVDQREQLARGTTPPITSRSSSPNSSPHPTSPARTALRFGATISQASWRLTQQHTRHPARDLQRPAAERQSEPGQRHAAHPDRPAQLDQERQRRCSRRTSGRSTARRSTPACAGTGS